MDVIVETLIPEPRQRTALASRIREITDRGMSGELSFAESLSIRLALLPKLPLDRTAVVARLRGALSASFVELCDQGLLSRIRVVSSGFREFIEPCLLPLGIEPERIHCNNLVFASDGSVAGVNTQSVLSQNGGKVALVESLGLAREIAVVGDGYTDYEIVKEGVARYFFAYSEFVRREKVTSQAIEILSDFHALTSLAPLASLSL